MKSDSASATRSLTEINTAYDSEWILLTDPQTTSSLEITGGRVLFHSKDRDEVYRKARELRPRHSAILIPVIRPKEWLSFCESAL